MDQTVLLPVEGSDKYKLTNLSEEQVSQLKKDPHNIFKVLAIGGGAYLAYETFMHLVNIPKEQWENMLPEDLEKFLTPMLSNFIDTDETLEENEAIGVHQHFMDEHDDTVDISADDDHNDTIDHHDTNDHTEIADDTIIDEQTEITDDDTATTIEIDDISDVIQDEGIDSDMVDSFVSETDFSIDADMLDYINSDEILVDLNDNSAEEVIINDEYIDGDDIDFDYDDTNDYDQTEDYDDDSYNTEKDEITEDNTDDYHQNDDLIDHDNNNWEGDDYTEDYEESDDYVDSEDDYSTENFTEDEDHYDLDEDNDDDIEDLDENI